MTAMLRNKPVLSVLLTLFGLGFATIAAAQTTWFVDANAVGPGSGTPAAPFPTIGAAVAAALPGDQVQVAAGAYPEVVDFQGKAIFLQGAGSPFDGDPNSHPVIISAGCLAAVPHLVLFTSGENLGSVLQGFEIRGACGLLPGQNGGGIRCVNSSPSIIGNLITDNESFERGGGIYCENADPVIIGNQIIGNTIHSTSLNGEGAGIFCTGSNPLIQANVIADNGGPDVLYGGGVALTFGSSPSLSSNRIANNTAAWGGAISFQAGANAILVNNLIHGNEALGATLPTGLEPGRGGGLWIQNSNPLVTNNTIYGNQAVSAMPSITTSSGGAVYLSGSDSGFYNSILWGNLANTQSAVGFDLSNPGSASFSFCNVESGINGLGNIDVDPQFVDPIGNPGLGQLPDFHLAPLSPCINAGDASAPGVPLLDIDTEPRIQCAAIDLGADEASQCMFVPLPFQRGDCNDDGSTNLSDVVFLLGYLFPSPSGPANDLLCIDAGDTNDDGTVNVSDVIFLLSALFGVPPVPLPDPAGSCAQDPTPDPLTCDFTTCQ